MFRPNLAACQLATCAENAVKFKLKLIKKWKRIPNKNEVGMEWETNCKIMKNRCRFFQNSNSCL